VKKILAYVALGVCVYLVFVIALFPADRAYSFAKPMLGNVKLYDVKGTLWRGRAAAAVVNGTAYRALTWRIAPWTVLLGRVDVDMSFDSGDRWAHGVVGLGIDKALHFRNLEAQMPARDLRSFVPRMMVPLAGVLSVRLEKGHYDPATGALGDLLGFVTWHEAALDMPNAIPLGAFRIDLQPGADGVNGTLKDSGEGPIVAQGTLLLKPDSSYQFNGAIAPRDTTRRDIVQALNFIGRADNDGRVKVSYSGKL
jgi:hypothetical protein